MIPPTLFCDTCGAANQPKASFCRTCGHPLQPAGVASRNTTTGRLLPNHLLKQRYIILDSVGKGGMGAVYKGEDTQLGNRKVAIKEMSQSGLSPQEVIEAANDFKREAHILAGLQHPNLPNIYDHFTEAGRWYLVMSFIHGETLEDYLDKANGGRLPVEEVLQIGIQLCTVLNYLHSQQPPIIFRDLKPSNIMQTVDGHLYLIDFGIARHFKLGQTKDTTAYGSIGYASPEQYGKAQTTPRSDIYSLGAVLYQLLSGHDPSATPFRFPPLQSLVPTVPIELVTLITQMLELDENNRPTSMLVVKQKLQDVASSLGSTSQKSPGVPASKSPIPPSVPVGSIPKPPVVSSSANARVKVFSYGRRQLAFTLVGIILYATTDYISFRIQGLSSSPLSSSPFLFGLSDGIVLVTPLFLGSISGSWVGLGAAGIGSVVAHALFGDISYFWFDPVIVALLGFAAGLTLLKSQGYYDNRRNIIFATVFNLLVYIIYIFLFLSIYSLIFRFNIFAGIVSFVLLEILFGCITLLILLPVLLIIFNAIVKHRSSP